MKLACEKFLALVRAAVFGSVEACADACTELEAAEEKRILTLAREHDLGHLLSIGAERCGVKLSDETRAVADSERMTAVYRHVGLRGELSSILATLEDGGIDHLPLKGSVIRAFYPEPWMRTSCDIDILVREEDLEKAKSLLESELEYKYVSMGNHDISLESPGGVHLELHYRPLNDYVLDDYDKPLADLFGTLRLQNGYSHRYEMPPEYFYYYHIAHMAKHYVNGGSGVRTVLDLYILLKNDPDLPQKSGELLKLGGLLAFEENARLLSNVWFEGGEHTDLTRDMENFIVYSGVYGDVKNMIAVRRGGGKGKLGYLITRAFPPYEIMCDVYPSLVGKRLLMPAYWVRRLFGIVFTPGKFKRSIKEIKTNSALSEKEMKRVASSVEKLGLRCK